MNPTLSIIIPIYKVENYLRRCVNSVLNQDYKDLEVILVDDGSPDGCPAICDEYACLDNRVRVIHKRNGGLSSARNEGIKISTGTYLAFLDSDDQWANVLKKLMDSIGNCSFDMLVFDSLNIYPNGDRKKRNNFSVFSKEFRILNTKDYYDEIIRNGDFMESACTKIINRDFLIKNDLMFCQGITGEDSEWMLRLLRNANKIAISNVELFLCTCRRTGSIQNTIKSKNILDLVLTIEKSLSFYQNNSDFYLKTYELEQCSYLYANALGQLHNITSSEEKREVKQELRPMANVLCYAQNGRTRYVKILYKIVGYDILVSILGVYLVLMKKNIVNRKRKINER